MSHQSITLLVLTLAEVIAEPMALYVTPMNEVPITSEPIADVLLFENQWTVLTEFKPTDVSELLSIARELNDQELRICELAANKLAKR